MIGEPGSASLAARRVSGTGSARSGPSSYIPVFLVGILFLAATSARAELSIEGELEWSSGEYRQPWTTQIWSLVTELSYHRGRWGVLVSLPVFSQDSSSVLHAGGVRVPTSHPSEHHPGHSGPGHGSCAGQQHAPADAQQYSGVGDPILRVDFGLPGYLPGGIALGFFAGVKPPIADADSGFSTGEWDVVAGLLAWRTRARTAASLEAGSWRRGDPPALELEDSLIYSLVVERSFPDRRFSLGGILRGSSSTIAAAGSAVEVGVTLARTLRDSRAVGLTFSAGLTDATPDILVSFGWRIGRLASWRVGRP